MDAAWHIEEDDELNMRLSEAAVALRGELIGADAEFFAVSTDSRTVASGQLFIALRGERFDGHAYISTVREKGAVAAIVDNPVADVLPQIVVDDTRLALGRLAAHWRTDYHGPLIGLTGSNGKTTVKEILATILRGQGSVLATRGNLNNDIGLPLTLLQLQPAHDYAVIEMGANHAGEIGYLTNLACPSVALITNAARAHLEGFGSLEGVARAKGEIFSGLSEAGVAVINADDFYAPLWRELAGTHKVIRFGLANEAEVTAKWQPKGMGSHMVIVTPQGLIEVEFALPGQHNVMNALAATAACLAMGVKLSAIQAGLKNVKAVPGRSQLKSGRGGATLIDDTYNANPASLQAALNVLSACKGRRILVMGDMAELGEESQALHEQIGRQAAQSGIDGLYATGEFSRSAVQSFGKNGHHFNTQEDLISALQSLLGPDVTLLIKGSRSARMEQVVAALILEESR
jgi:UDP-N-acetylmuramoyl-tripeptide--D-alanyl-D-alanine ligase